MRKRESGVAESFTRRRHYKKNSSEHHSPSTTVKKPTHPLAVVDIGLKSVLPVSTKCPNTSSQSSRVSQEILDGESTSTGITWLISPHWMMITAVPIPPLFRHRSSRRRMSSSTSGSLSVTYVRGTMCVAFTANLTQHHQSTPKTHTQKETRGDEPTQRIRRRPITQLDEQRLLADVRRQAFQLESLEPRPAQERRVRRGELAQTFNDVLVVPRASGVLLRRRDLPRGVLAYRLVRGPVGFLARLRLLHVF